MQRKSVHGAAHAPLFELRTATPQASESHSFKPWASRLSARAEEVYRRSVLVGVAVFMRNRHAASVVCEGMRLASIAHRMHSSRGRLGHPACGASRQASVVGGGSLSGGRTAAQLLLTASGFGSVPGESGTPRATDDPAPRPSAPCRLRPAPPPALA